MKIYVDNQISNVNVAWQANASFQNTWLTNLQANVDSLSANISGNSTTKPYGSYWDNTTTTVANIQLAYIVPIANTFGNLGVSISSTNRIVFPYSGIYKITASLQFLNTDNAQQDITIWLRKNGTDIDNSGSVYTAASKGVGSTPGKLIAVVPFVEGPVNANDYYQIVWNAQNTGVSHQGIAAGTNPTRPASPATMIMVQKI